MQIAIIGPGGIGSTFAFQLSLAGHDVTVIARGRRLEQLRADGAIVTADGERADVSVADELDASTPWDLVLVTVLVSQVDVLLPTLTRSRAATVMFMFNTFQSLDRLRDSVGAHRFAFGFPAIVASLTDGTLSANILRRGMSTTVTDPLWAKAFSDAGIPTTVEPDMQSWLRTHAAVIVPLAIAGGTADRRGSGLSKRESLSLADAMKEGFRLVRHLGDTVTPAHMSVLGWLPTRVLAVFLWMLTRIHAFVQTVAVAPVDEPRMLIDEMSSAWPGHTPALLAVRP
jgi:2-dehydropantoate 2-reductase